MSKTVIAIDPVTRLEGHLKVEVQVEDGKVADAWITGGMFRLPEPRNGLSPADQGFGSSCKVRQKRRFFQFFTIWRIVVLAIGERERTCLRKLLGSTPVIF